LRERVAALQEILAPGRALAHSLHEFEARQDAFLRQFYVPAGSNSSSSSSSSSDVVAVVRV
jgi:hypothetical protein